MNPKVELLTAAKRYLWDGITPASVDRYGYICGALAEALRSEYLHADDYRQACSLTESIDAHIAPYHYLHADDYRQAYHSLTERISAHISPHCYFSAWLKRHYPAEFLTAMVNSQPLGFYSNSQLVQDAQRHHVKICVCLTRGTRQDQRQHFVSHHIAPCVVKMSVGSQPCG